MSTKRVAINRMLAINHEQSALFTSAASYWARKKYTELHTTLIIVLKCMDGRLNLSVMTKTPMGILIPFRNLGGRFDLGWKGFYFIVRDLIAGAMKSNRKVLILTTYHFSESDVGLGCKGFKNDRKAAERYSKELKQQFDYVFGEGDDIRTIQVGIETDKGSLLFHSENGDNVVELAKLAKAEHQKVIKEIKGCYLNLPEKILFDLLPLVFGNLEYINEAKNDVQAQDEAHHRESVLGIGRAFHWLHKRNAALIINPFDLAIEGGIGTGAGLIYENITSQRIDPDEGVLLMTAAPYDNRNISDKREAEVHSRTLMRFALGVIGEQRKELLPYLETLTTMVNMDTLALDVLDMTERGILV